MKKLILFGFVVLLSFSIGISNSYAQCPTPAPNDHPGVPFIGPITGSVESPAGSGCFMSFEYCWRVTPWNGGEVEIYVGELSPGPGCSGLWNVNTVTRDASRKIIMDLRPWETTISGTGNVFFPITPPCPALSNTRYRILAASCYSELYFNGSKMVRKPCGDGNNGRCEEGWRLCYEWVNGVKVIKETVIDKINNGATCTESKINVGTVSNPTELDCIPECP